jgi:glycosyltransferase involved in cell wall biosynthesis
VAPFHRLKIGILLDAIYPYHQGGRETLHFERSTRLAQHGHSVRIFTAHWWPEPEPEIVRDGVVFRAVGPRVRMYTPGGRRSIWQTVVFSLSALQLLWSPDFDVLDVDQFPFGHFFLARLICTLRRKPMTATWHEVWDSAYWKRYIGWLGPVGVLLQRASARRADLIFANSTLTASRSVSWLGIDPTRVLVLPPAGIESIPSPSPSPVAGEAWGGGSQKIVDCIFIGRLLPHKHVDVLLHALAVLPGVTGLILGVGPERERLVMLATKLGLQDRVHFESPSTHEAAIERLQGARLLVSPSTREGFGITVFEANACGVPALVVQDHDNASTELIDDGVNGFITNLDPLEIADRIKTYLGDPAAQARMSRAAHAAASTYSWENYVTRMEAALASLSPSPVAAGGQGSFPSPLSGEGGGPGKAA